LQQWIATRAARSSDAIAWSSLILQQKRIRTRWSAIARRFETPSVSSRRRPLDRWAWGSIVGRGDVGGVPKLCHTTPARPARRWLRPCWSSHR